MVSRPVRPPRLRLLATSFAATLLLLARPVAAESGPWVPDRGDGTYRNPVLHADYSDPDAIRVGDDFWLTSSSFNHSPGLPILHSRDLVNWELVGHALPLLVPAKHFATVRHGEGVWAPAIRFHDGKFFIFYPDPDYGIYVVTATNPRAAWSAPVLVIAGKGLIDPCPFWDDDGQAYLVHAWARSRGPVANRLTLVRMSADGFRALDAGRDIIDGNTMPGWRTIEGPKLYKRQGWYYVFAPAGGVQQGYQAVFRSRVIYGPYENRVVLAQNGTSINGPHQGAWVDTGTGQDWFLHFQDKGPYGRVVHLEPMAWRKDGWPAIGTAAESGATDGAPVLTHAKPKVGGPAGPVTTPATSDEFNTPQLGLQWQWQANPTPDAFTLTDRPGYLRLRPLPLPETGVYDAPQLLTQKFPAPKFTATAALDGTALGENSEAGLIVFGYSCAWVGLRREQDGLKLVYVEDHRHDPDSSSRLRPGMGFVTESHLMPDQATHVLLRVTVDPGAQCRFSYSQDGRRFLPLHAHAAFPATVDRWVGSTVGVFAANARERSSGTAPAPVGFADFDWFHLE
ncbi:MAG TPA: glycoside hydrolase 43 family protein [Opitutaceae bacterium]|nr:glycoside hydrolase 43 family protein [Opitutaceae bacterium]